MISHLRIRWIVSLLLILQISCHKVTQSEHIKQDREDSLSSATEESVLPSDSWIKYSYVERQGKRLFEQYCAVCHGLSGEGDGFNAYNLNPRPHSLADSAYMKDLSGEILVNIIAFGGTGVNKSVLMPAYRNTLTKAQISYIGEYIETFTSTSSN